MLRTTLAALLFTVSAPAFAQVSHDDMNHSMDHADHDHSADPHEGHDMMESDSALTLTNQPDIMAAVAAGGEPIVAKVLGAVCDFCAKAMNKTFGKRDDVAAVYVDLDSKTLNLVLKPGAVMTDETLRDVVKKSGYKVDVIARGTSIISG